MTHQNVVRMYTTAIKCSVKNSHNHYSIIIITSYKRDRVWAGRLAVLVVGIGKQYLAFLVDDLALKTHRMQPIGPCPTLLRRRVSATNATAAAAADVDLSRYLTVIGRCV